MYPAATLLLSNAACALVLAVPALLVSRLARRPALAHALWLLVLLKLVTPPLIDLPLPTPPPAPEPAQAAAPAAVAAVPQELPAEEGAVEAEDELPAVGEAEQPRVVLVESRPPAAEEALPEPEAPAWPALFATLSLAGTACWLGLTAWRWRCFHRALACARPAPKALVEHVYALAARLELARPPTVWLVPGRVSPMLWGLLGRPRLLLPAQLWAALSREQQETLLLHELAHLKRRDHRVRLLELVVTALYWWHPVVWLARRELREAEEQCCDAWVVWASPQAARSYANALLECVDFLSAADAPLPVGASGIGRVDDLKRRLTMIMSRATPRCLRAPGLVLVLGLAALLLPAAPTWGQSAPPAKKPDKEDADKARAEMEKLRDQLEEQLSRAKETEKKLRDAVEKLNRIEKEQGGTKRNVRVIIISEDEENRGGGGGGRPVPVRGGGDNQYGPNTRPPQGGQNNPPQGQGWGTRPMQPGPGQGMPPGPQGDKRMEDLERRLEGMMKEIEELRRQLRNQPRPGPGSGSGIGPGPGSSSGTGMGSATPEPKPAVRSKSEAIEIELKRSRNRDDDRDPNAKPIPR